MKQAGFVFLLLTLATGCARLRGRQNTAAIEDSDFSATLFMAKISGAD